MKEVFLPPKARFAVAHGRDRSDLVLPTGLIILLGCVGIIGDPGSDSGFGSGGASSGPTHLPCDVQALLAQHCQACHTDASRGALVTRADLVTPSRSDPSRSMAAVALERMEAPSPEHMPPAPLEPGTPDEVAAFRSWVEQGMPEGSCAQEHDAGTDPYDTPVVCSSGTHWTGGNEESPLMRPGGACISCHTREHEGPDLAIAGTLFPTPHEPNDCNGVDANTDATVVLTDALGAEFLLRPNRAGNFFLEQPEFAYPYQARIEYAGRLRVMVESQTSGDCNRCHTEAGAENAPGRIFLP